MLLQSQSRYYENVFRLVGRFRFAARPQILPADELRGAERARHRGFRVSPRHPSEDRCNSRNPPLHSLRR